MFKLAVFLIALVSYSEGARILAVFPIPSISHQVVFRPLTQELAKRGHNVTVVTTDPAFPKDKTPENLTEIDFHDFAYEKWEELYKITSTGEDDLVAQLVPAFKLVNDLFEMMVKRQEMKKLFKEEFDLLLIEACARPALTLSYVFKTPVILVSSFGSIDYNLEAIGSPIHPILYPSNLRQRVYNLTYYEKITELWNTFWLNQGLNAVEKLENEMARRNFGPDIPSMSELKNNVHMLFLNVHPLWESNRPVPPSVVYMGGLHQKPTKELPQDLKKYLDLSKNGVIYMSLGTNVKPSLLPPEKISILLKVFSTLPYDVLWKWDKDELPGRSQNIQISKWLPQSDLLKHPKIKLFITQGGLQSTDEAITAGVPLIGIPMLGDQWYNVEQYEYHKIGIRLDITSLTEEELKSAIYSILNDNSYRAAVVRLRSLMSDQPERPLERATWWVEHVLRHGGGEHLRAPAANMGWSEYLELELVLTALAILLSASVVVVAILYKVCSIILRYLPGTKKMKMT